jgi:PAS domain S-box-containing protein
MLFPGKGAVMVDLEGRIEFASNYFCDLMGITTTEVVGKSCFEFVFPEDLSKAKELLELNKQPNPVAFRFRLRRTDGTAVWTNIQGAPMLTASGETYAVVATVTAPEDGQPSET